MMAYLLGIDVGTTGTRALVIDEAGTVVASATFEHPLLTPRPGWADQDPHEWWTSTARAVRRVLANGDISGKDITAIGLSGQMHGSVFLDEKNEVIRPAILWCDQRTGPQCEWITEEVGAEVIAEETCNPVLTGFQAPKIIWLRQEEPENYARVRKVLLPKDYIRFLLTGEFATEVSDASGTSLFNVKKRAWSEKILNAIELDPGFLPPAYESPVPSTTISKQAAEELGLAQGAPVVGGGGDQAAGAVGNGIVRSGVVSSTLGTSGVVFAFLDEPLVDPQLRTHTFCHAVPGKWHVMGAMLSAGGSLRWIRDALCGTEKEVARLSGRDPYEVMCEEAASVPMGSEGLIFLPYLTGERAPYPDPNARGVFFGLHLRHTRAHLIRAVLEGVAYGMRDSFDILDAMGVPMNQVRGSGGGARSPVWLQIQADVMNRVHWRTNVEEGPALGVALLAGVGARVWSSVEEACDAVIQVTTPVQPNADAAARYAEYHAQYRRLYPALREEFQRLARLPV